MILQKALLGMTFLSMTSAAFGQEARLLRHPSISDSSIVFTYANDVWVVGRDGGEALRLTSFQGSESNPHFSPDGSMVAFTGQYDGTTEVFVVPC
ncbi:MAG: PD40 domain-containing protein, partial [Planctomycetes bacterium]|nr:PD40 domain-containing protein [Planctomycetota bacterium]